MRNLKKVLSLALAMVMLLGMMVVGAGATSFTDDADITHQEAVTVVSGMEILTGVGDNTFNPKGTLSRAEAAVVIAKLDLGAAFGNLATTNASTFKDVGAGYGWAKPYIDYCAARGLIAGDGNGYFMPADKVTGVQFALMVARVLGYEDANENIGGADWEVNAAALARKAGLTIDVELGSNAIPRDDMAQVAFNALTADMVEYKQSAITIGDITIPAGKASPVENKGTGAVDYDETDSGNDGILQLCEQKFPNLKKATGEEDAFGRPATHKWTYKSKDVYSAPQSDVLTFNAKTSANDVAKALKNYKVLDNASTPNKKAVTDKNFVTGLIKNENDNGAAAITVLNTASDSFANEIAKLTENGKVVEIYADEDSIITDVVVLSYKVDTVASIVESKDGDYRKTTYGFDTFSASNLNNNNKTFTDPDKDDTIVIHGDVEEGDVVTILTLATETHVYPTTTVTGTQSAYNTGNRTITVSGTTYTVGTGVAKDAVVNYVLVTDFANSTKETEYYLDQFECVVKSIEVESNDYAVIDAVRWTQQTTALDQDGQASARLIFADGSTENVVLNKLNGEKFDDAANNTNTVAISSGTGAKNFVSTTQANNNAVYAGQIVTYVKKDNGTYDLRLKTSTNSATGSNTSTTNNVSTVSGNTSGSTVINAITKGVPTIGNGITVAGDNNTIYIVKTEDSSGSSVYNAYTGYQNVPTVKLAVAGTAKTAKISYVAPATGAVDYVFIDATNAEAGETKAGDLVYIMDATKYNVSGEGSDETYTFTVAAFNGEAKDVVFDKDTFDAGVTVGLYEVKTDDDGVVTSATAQTTTGTTFILTATLSASAKNGVVAGYTYKGDETVWVVDGDTIYKGTPESARAGDDIYVKVVDKDATDADLYAIKEMYVVKPQPVALNVSTQPIAKNYFNGATMDNLTVAAAGGEGGYTYQWKESTDSGVTWNDSAKTGNATATLTMGTAATANNGTQYKCVITDVAGNSVESNAVTIGIKAFSASLDKTSISSAGDVKVTATCATPANIAVAITPAAGATTSNGSVANVTTLTSAAATTVYTWGSGDSGTVNVEITVTETNYVTYVTTLSFTIS